MYKRILYLLFVIPLIAGTTGKIRGKVVDSQTNSPLIGCNVYLASTNYGSSADIDGNFLILNIPAGTYDMYISMIGYDTYIRKNVEVNLDLTTTINVSLSLFSRIIIQIE